MVNSSWDCSLQFVHRWLLLKTRFLMHFVCCDCRYSGRATGRLHDIVGERWRWRGFPPFAGVPIMSQETQATQTGAQAIAVRGQRVSCGGRFSCRNTHLHTPATATPTRLRRTGRTFRIGRQRVTQADVAPTYICSNFALHCAHMPFV